MFSVYNSVHYHYYYFEIKHQTEQGKHLTYPNIRLLKNRKCFMG